MHSRFRAKSVTLSALAALIALLVVPGTLLAKPKPGTPGRGFRLMARATGAMTVNRIYCGLSSTGEICVDSLGSSTIGGGFWPKGSPQQYVFNSGLQVAGSVDPLAGGTGFAWHDTTGAFFFDPKGTTQHGEQIEPIYNSLDRDDNEAWPDAARVPAGDATADLFDLGLQGRKAAGQGDIWTLAWDGNPGLNAGRSHPLGVAVETRGLGWNYPTFNNDIVYFIYTFYNVTSACAGDYAAVRPAMRDIVTELGTRFQTLNNAAFGVTIPNCGYTIKNFYANFAADMDVSSTAGNNYSSVNLPFALGYTYEDTFRPTDNNFRLPADLGSAPFINGYGFVGVKYLKSPIDPTTGEEAGIRLFSNSVNGGLFGDPQNAQQLFRYVSGTINPALGDGNCNYSPSLDRICYVKSDGHADMRFFQSSGPFDLAPGQFGSVVVAYIFASAVASPGCPAASCAGLTASVTAGDARLLSNAALLVNGANLIDSLTGFRGYTDANGDSTVQQSEVATVKGSLLGKALVAQAIFDNKFLLPAAPDAPDFFLVPGDNSVTVVWRKSPSETDGDFYFAAASDPGTPAAPNLLYDPNYREFDVEGYRVYRGRVDNPSSLTLLAQFDYNTTTMDDYLGAINPTPDCAPELGNETGCNVDFNVPLAGYAYTTAEAHDIISPFIQVKIGSRTSLGNRDSIVIIDTLIRFQDSLDINGDPVLDNEGRVIKTGTVLDTLYNVPDTIGVAGDAIILASDTAVTGTESGSFSAELTNSGVPFVYQDNSAKNNLRYFYTVTAFDVNSIQSGPTNLESPRVTKAVTPFHAATNYRPEATLSVSVRGRGVLKSPGAPVPTLDGTTGQFSGPMPVANGIELGLVGDFVTQIVNGSGEFFARLDSLTLGKVSTASCCGGGGEGIPAHYYYTVSNGTTSSQIDFAFQQDISATQTGTGLFDGIVVDNTLGGLYGGNDDFSLLAAVKPSLLSVGYMGAAGFQAALGTGFAAADFAAVGTTGFRYDGARWYSGANEATADPTSPGMCGTGIAACSVTTIPNLSNAGSVNGATVVYIPKAYQNINREYRNIDAILAGARRAADIRFYWGAGGVVDSVIDITHNVVVPFENNRLGAGWAIMTTPGQVAATGSKDARTNTLTFMDWVCVEPLKTMHQSDNLNGAGPFFNCPTGPSPTLTNTAVLGQVAMGVGDNQSTGNARSVRNTANNSGNGFSIYVAGYTTFFGGMTALPAAGETWTLRGYHGVIFGGKGSSALTQNPGNLGPYRFVSKPRSLTAVGAEVVFNYDVNQNVTASTAADLRRVHTVPDPYYVTNAFERSFSGKVIKFVNLPNQAIVRIYSTSGVLVRVLEHNAANFDGSLDWDVRNRNEQVVASGVYFYHIETPSGERRVGRMTIVNFAQ